MADSDANSSTTQITPENPSVANESSAPPLPAAPDSSETVQPTSTDPGATATPQQTLSKNAQKKLAKAAYHQQRKLEWRAREKAAKKEKKRLLREERQRQQSSQPQSQDVAAGTSTVGEDDTDAGTRNADGQPARKRARYCAYGTPFNARVVIDLGFDSYMTDRVRIYPTFLHLVPVIKKIKTYSIIF